MSFKNFFTLSNVGIMVEEELAMGAHTKSGSNWKSNYKDEDKKGGYSSNREVYVINCYTEHNPIETAYAEALEHLLVNRKIDLLEMKPETQVTMQLKSFDLIKYYKYRSAQGYSTENY